ncbi:MAG TPA: hypothetical protein VHF05_03480 [Candidatus Paceibacterota bacterium]|jgi:hypothetical protein|nr:hypothetical protein [Candidatus Paceibacterota bacterium]
MRYTPKFILKTSLVAIVCGFVAGYTLFQAQSLLKGPVVTLDQTARLGGGSDVAEIGGVAKNVAYITFNGRRIYTDTNGDFKEKFALSDGYNIVKITATDKFGRETDKTVELVYDEPAGGDSLSMQTINSTYGKTN